MSSIGGSRKEVKEFTPRVGFTEANIVAICPTNEQLRKMGMDVADDAPEIEYISEKEGVNKVRIDIHYEEVKSKYKFKKSIFLEDVNSVTKPKEGMSQEEVEAFIPKTQYVNQVGDSTWIDDASNLRESFVNFRRKKGDEYELYGDKEYRVARKGEADLLDFLRKWLNGVDFRKTDATVLIDMKKLFKGNFKELQEQVGGEFTTDQKGVPFPLVELLEVKEVVKDDELKQYQSVYKTSLPGYLIRVIRNTKFTEELIQGWRDVRKTKDNPKGRYLKNYEQFAVDVTDSEFGSKNHFVLAPFQEYSPENSFVASGKILTVTGSDF